jgi:hypothetical protein
MSFASKPKKVVPKGTVRELKLVHTINRHGAAIVRTEEVKTPRKNKQKTPTTSQRNYSSDSKRQKLENFDVDPIELILEGPDGSTKRPTLVFLSLFLFKTIFLTIF